MAGLEDNVGGRAGFDVGRARPMNDRNQHAARARSELVQNPATGDTTGRFERTNRLR
jgi:hypothetical protein